uniref:Putative RND superfamily transporter n=1 Tax=uncultured marine thaumarchaeote KM3_53_E03 TaxID=1456184 RepID=A0A075H5W7_9ARCH|nr:putative RND superfamily transporter [uncultured marine thaumarchaeote KM3_53_E03]
MISAGYLSQTYLDSALKGGQGTTKDLEFNLAQKLKDNKMVEFNQISGSDSIENGTASPEEHSDEPSSDNLLIVTSEIYTFPSEQFESTLNSFFTNVQSEIDKSEIEINIGQLPDYDISVSEDGSTILISAPFVSGNLVSPLIHLTEEVSDNEFQYYFIGTASIEHTFQELAEKDLVTGETIGISVAIIILALVFGSVISALIPVILAIVAIFVSIGIVSILGQFVDLNDFVPNIMTMMGLAVGIDYCLFVLSRYREERQKGLEKREAIVSSGTSAGRAVIYSGMTVVLALVGMFIIPEKTFQAFGVGAILVVFVAVLAATTLLPALIGILGDKINSFHVPKLLTIILYGIGFLFIAITQELGPKLLFVSAIVMGLLILLSFLRTKGWTLKVFENKNRSDNSEKGFWNWITIQVMNRPYISMVIAAGFLIILGYFYFDLEKGTSGISVLPDDEPVKIGFSLLDEKFGFGSDAPAVIVLDADINSKPIGDAINKLEINLSDDKGFLKPDINLFPSVDFAELNSKIPGDPQNQNSLNSIKRLRNEIIPEAFKDVPSSSYTIYVGGTSAQVVDSVELTDDYFPIVVGLVLGLSLILLLLAFRSITISIASIIMNLLSVGAAYGLLVLVFQKGFMIGVFGFEQVEQLEFWLPLFMFSILFGLSMDYHVFMLSRIKEHFDETQSADDSVAFGLRKTASIITGAALIMVAVFGGFALGEIAFFQSMGFGLGAAVLIDATVVRSILVPSIMKLLGSKAWYLPKWLNWIPNISIEGNRTKLNIKSND